jgi:hypothetical protein
VARWGLSCILYFLSWWLSFLFISLLNSTNKSFPWRFGNVQWWGAKWVFVCKSLVMHVFTKLLISIYITQSLTIHLLAGCSWCFVFIVTFMSKLLQILINIQKCLKKTWMSRCVLTFDWYCISYISCVTHLYSYNVNPLVLPTPIFQQRD